MGKQYRIDTLYYLLIKAYQDHQQTSIDSSEGSARIIDQNVEIKLNNGETSFRKIDLLDLSSIKK